MLGGDETLPLLRQQFDARYTQTAEAEEELSSMLARLQTLEGAVRRAQEAQDRADQERAATRRLAEEARTRFPAMPIESEALERLRAEFRYLSSALASLRDRGMAGRQLEVLDRDISNQSGILERMRARLEALDTRVRAGEDIARWIGAQVVSATTEIVRTSTPLINELYARLDVHPYLRRFDFRSDRFYEAGRVRPWVYDDERKVSGNAAQVLSSAQLNALAVCLFLALNIGQRSSNLDIAVLDDPVQSMDDVNVLGLADTLRSVRRHRQLIVSTHDPALADLLWRKLRPLQPAERTRLVELSEWTTAGPRLRVESRDPELARERLELIAS
jgi:DNA repair exonuclease SbcCD ATPase subunit